MNKRLHIQKNFHLWQKISLMLFFAILFTGEVLAASALQKNVTIKLQNATIKSVLEEVQKQTGLSFIYNSKDLEALPRQNVSVKDGAVEVLLNQIFTGTDFTYKVMDNNISITKNPIKTLQKPIEKITVKGKVVDDEKKPISGATIIVLGSTNGAITDEKGAFTLAMNKGQEIEVTFIGMTTIKRTITKSETNLVIEMTKDAIAMDDVVVTGIFERRAGSFTGSATTFNSSDLKQVGNSNVIASLRNLDPSLMVFDNLEFGSDPNRNPKMSLRGTSEINLGGDLDLKGAFQNDPNAPLFILDGFETSLQKIMDLDMNRVDKISILKDASAKALYGSKAANGVIVIETKRTTEANLRVTYTGSVNVQATDLTSYNLTNAAQKLELEKDAGFYYDKNADTELGLLQQYYAKKAVVLSGVDTDWLAKPARAGVGTKHGVSFEIGTDKLNLIASFSYNNILGTMKGSDRTNYEGAISLSYRYKNIAVRNNLTVTSNVAHDSPYGSFSQYASINPYYSPVDEDGNIVKNINVYKAPNGTVNGEAVDNPLYNAQLNIILKDAYVDITNNTSLEWTILPGLKAVGRFGITEKRTRGDEFYPANHLKFKSFTGDDFFRKGSYRKDLGEGKILSGDANLQFSREMALKHYVFANVGLNLSENGYEELYYEAEGFPNDRMNDMIFAKGYAKDQIPGGSEAMTRDFGIVFVGNYAYDNRYLVDGSYRTNASSQFGKNNRWGQFWSAGLGWNIHNEKWLRDSKIQQFKLRASMGYTGSQGGASYGSISSYKYILDKTYMNFLGATLKGMYNNDLKWQEKLDYNVGIDFNLGRLFSMKVDYYIAETKNSVLDLDIPSYTGFSTVKENVGNVTNKGFDVRLTSSVWSRPKDRAHLTLNLLFSHNKNKVTNVSAALDGYNKNQDTQADDIFNNKPVLKYQDGVSIDAIWAVKSLGIDPANGRELYLQKDGSMTYTYRSSNLVVCGNSLPKLHGNFGLSFAYKGFEFNTSFRFQYGAQLYNQTLVDKVENANIKDNVDLRTYDGRWRKPGDIKPYKTLGNRWVAELSEYKDENTQATSRFVQDRNELSLASLSVGYDFYRFEFLKKIKMERMRFNFYMNDVFMISSIKVERGTSYPFARSFNFQLELTF